MRAALASGALLLAFAGQAQAATTVGETFMPVDLCFADRTNLQTASPGGKYTVPSAGVITAWSFQADASPPQLEFKVARPVGGNSFTILGESTLKAPTPNTLNTYTDVRIPVQPGDVIGLYTATSGNCNRQVVSGGYSYHYVVGDVAAGTTQPFNASSGYQHDISARLEPDADNDGFGDETQDRCPTDPTTQAGCPTPCQGTTVASTNGTEGNDTLVGTPADDAIFGLGGDDTLDGVDGNDCLDGGDGEDTVRGGAGNDLAVGGDANDKLRGVGGKDKLKGGEGNDRMNGGEAKDTLSGGAGKDKMRGAAAKDKYKGNAGDDRLNAVDAKTDRVNCGGGDDKAVVDPIDRVSRNCESVREVEREN